jgi:hypothetical protein
MMKREEIATCRLNKTTLTEKIQQHNNSILLIFDVICDITSVVKWLADRNNVLERAN